ncbi:MAG: hypothetical protein KKD39_09150, partial [Candidatus Altiarchaeota archaeon]|nr:hypothetical protein [Candidatus Altiarchaeota archaeon]
MNKVVDTPKIEHLPSLQEAVNPRHECLKMMPPEHIADYTTATEVLKTDADWKSFRDSLRQVPPQYRIYFTCFVMPALKASNALKTDEDWRMHTKNYNVSRDEMPQADRIEYTCGALPALIAANALKTDSDWINYRDSLNDVSPEFRVDYTRYILPALATSGGLKTDEDWKTHATNYRESSERIPERHREYYTQHALPDIISTGDFTWDAVEEGVTRIEEYTNRYGNLDFIWKVGLDNFGKFGSPDSIGKPLEIMKTGGRLYAFDGRHIGVILRKMDKTAYRMWVKALEDGIPCEEILKYSEGHRLQGQYRDTKTQDGEMMVACFWGGPTITEFLRDPENKKYEEEVRRQKRAIREMLQSKRICHG